MLTAPTLTFVFIGIVFGLGTALVWMFWEIEPVIARMRRGKDRVFRDPFGGSPR
jgi:HAMP domain-containing protein